LLTTNVHVKYALHVPRILTYILVYPSGVPKRKVFQHWCSQHHLLWILSLETNYRKGRELLLSRIVGTAPNLNYAEKSEREKRVRKVSTETLSTSHDGFMWEPTVI